MVKPKQRSNTKDRIIKSVNTKKKRKRTKKKHRTAYKGFYKGIKCDSRWELAFLIYCLNKGRNVQRCKLTFKYIVRGKEHTYYPDFICNGIIIEIKGKWKKNLKYKLQCVKDAGYKIKLIDAKKIKLYLNYCYKKYNTKELQKLYDK